jgi:hypothetical protein
MVHHRSRPRVYTFFFYTAPATSMAFVSQPLDRCPITQALCSIPRAWHGVARMSDTDKHARFAANLMRHAHGKGSISSGQPPTSALPRPIAPNPAAVKRPGSPLLARPATRRPAPPQPVPEPQPVPLPRPGAHVLSGRAGAQARVAAGAHLECPGEPNADDPKLGEELPAEYEEPDAMDNSTPKPVQMRGRLRRCASFWHTFAHSKLAM